MIYISDVAVHALARNAHVCMVSSMALKSQATPRVSQQGAMACLFVVGSHKMMHIWLESRTWNLINAVNGRRMPMHTVDLPA